MDVEVTDEVKWFSNKVASKHQSYIIYTIKIYEQLSWNNIIRVNEVCNEVSLTLTLLTNVTKPQVLMNLIFSTLISFCTTIIKASDKQKYPKQEPITYVLVFVNK